MLWNIGKVYRTRGGEILVVRGKQVNLFSLSDAGDFENLEEVGEMLSTDDRRRWLVFKDEGAFRVLEVLVGSVIEHDSPDPQGWQAPDALDYLRAVGEGVKR